ncbi:MAG: hypothetical protein IKW11_01140 [Bacteroidales bacterium]|nr:hypothetical protein [Bacteroidales bacterium]
MNIIVKPYGSDLCYCRPDTTWERENKDFYSPECVNEIYWTPVVFARISKAGKCVGKKFVERYYDGIGCGMLMYCGNSTVVDKSSILPHPLFQPVVFEDEKKFVVNVSPINQYSSVILSGAKDLLEEAICNTSQLTSLRIGDFVAVELKEQQKLANKEDGTVALRGEFCEKEIFSFSIIF